MKTIIRYKLTTQDLTTFNDTKWVLNKWKETSGNGELCDSGWLHCYNSPLLAILLNHIHARIDNPKLFKCEVEGKCLTDYGLKEGWTRMRIIEEIEIPQLSNINKVAFGILCALEVCKEESFVTWANNWLENKDRSKESARYAVYRYAANATNVANAAVFARYAAYDAAYYAAAATADAFARFAAYADAAVYAARNKKNINLIKLVKKCLKIS